MAESKYEYVKGFELDDALLPNTYIVVRVDGRGFSKFTAEHAFGKASDVRGVSLMNQCAAEVLKEWGEIVLAFGQSDEYSFVLPRHATVFGRRSAKIATGIASLFAASFVFHWATFFPGQQLHRPPAFDARCTAYPSLENVCDYLRWRQVDTHINALHNEVFWALVLLGAYRLGCRRYDNSQEQAIFICTRVPGLLMDYVAAVKTCLTSRHSIYSQ